MKSLYTYSLNAAVIVGLSAAVRAETVDVPVLVSQSAGKTGSGVELIAGSDSSIISIAHKDAFMGNGKNPPQYTYKFVLSAPVDKNEDYDPFGNLEGVVDGLAFEVEFERWVSNRRTPTEEDDIRKEELCKIATENYISNESLPADTKGRCDDEDWLRLHLSSSEYAEREWMFWDKTHPRWAWGINIRVGNEDHEYLDSDSLQEKSEGEQPWLLGAYYVIAFKQPMINRWLNKKAMFTPGALNIGVKYGQKYKKQKEQTLCLDPIATPLVCSTNRIGAPEEIDQKLVYLEYRSFIYNTAYSLRFTHDLESDDSGVDLPIFFLQDKKDNWTGGLRLGWTKEEHGQASLFVGKAFRLY